MAPPSTHKWRDLRMIVPIRRACVLCGETLFTMNLGSAVCQSCRQETSRELSTKGTMRGMEVKPTDQIYRLYGLDVITNKSGADARIHIANKRNVLKMRDGSVNALCRNRLTHIKEIRPLVKRNSSNMYQTHTGAGAKWCALCEKSLRKLLGGVRMHDFSIFDSGGVPFVIGRTADSDD